MDSMTREPWQTRSIVVLGSCGAVVGLGLACGTSSNEPSGGDGGTSSGGDATHAAESSGGSGSGSGGTTEAGGPPREAGAPADGGHPVGAGFAVVTNRYDNARSGVNLEESVLTTTNVSSSQFGLLFSRHVDGQIYGQPLYVSRLPMPDGIVHDVVYVATEHNSVFAFDATQPTASTPLWKRALEPSGTTGIGGITCDNLAPDIGITSTPVIDPATGTMFVVDKSYDGRSWAQYIHALDVVTGADRPGSPLAIAATVKGTASDAHGGMVSFNPMTELGRPGLLLQGGVVYMAFASHCDSKPYHGWILGYAYGAAGFTQTMAYNVTPDGSEGGIWQAGVGLSSDGTSLYAVIGNGSTNPTSNPPVLAEAVVRISLSTSKVEDYWVPAAYVSMNQADYDLSAGAVLLPHGLLITGSKAGQVYLLDQANLGKYNAAGDTIRQTLTTPGKVAGQLGHLHGGPIDYTLPDGGEQVFLWPEDSQLASYGLDPVARKLVTNSSGGPLAQGGFAATAPGHPGGIMTLSANKSSPGTAILWASTPKDGGNGAWHHVDPGILYAVDAADITHVLWSANPMTIDDGGVGYVAKFNSPVVADGRVYVATFSNALNVYGLK
jgi:hypothetical protein